LTAPQTPQELARESLLKFLSREPNRIVLVGPVSLWLRGGYGLNKTEKLIEGLVDEGILRYATPEELATASLKHGYFLTEGGRKLLPPMDTSPMV
jgi:hypothetical protein